MSHIDRYLVPIVIFVIVVSLIPVVLELRRAGQNRTAARSTG